MRTANCQRAGIDELYVVYTRFVNSVTQTPTIAQVAPVKQAGDDSGEDAPSDTDAEASDEKQDGPQPVYDFEPDPRS